MKIKTKVIDYGKVMALKKEKKHRPLKTMFIFRLLLLILCCWDLLFTKFRLTKIGMDKLGKKEPCLYLMNHSAFMDMKIANCILFPRPINIVASVDAFIGKSLLMRLIGCIPARKFIADTQLVKDLVYCTKKLKTSILMFPEAGYTFDGTSTTLPESLGKCLKLLKVPVVMIKTQGVFLRDPLYNRLQIRKVKTSATMEYLLSPEDIERYSVDELNAIIAEQFSFDNFRHQQENKIAVSEPFRADGLNRVLYKCPHCLAEGEMTGKGTTLKCQKCKKEYELTELGFMKALNGETEFSHIPDWYRWERECVKQEVVNGTYNLDVDVNIGVILNTKCFYMIGEGRLAHSLDGFKLIGCNGRLEYTQKPLSAYSINSDFFWYEIDDVITIGTKDIFYFCFPKNCGDVVTKARLAQEEIYKMHKVIK